MKIQPTITVPLGFARSLLEYLLTRPCGEVLNAVQILNAAIEQVKKEPHES